MGLSNDVVNTMCSTIHGTPVFLHKDDMIDLMMACLLSGDRTTAWHCATGCLPLDKKGGKNVITGTMEDLL